MIKALRQKGKQNKSSLLTALFDRHNLSKLMKITVAKKIIDQLANDTVRDLRAIHDIIQFRFIDVLKLSAS